MKTLETLQAEHAAALAQLNTEQSIREALAAVPTSVPVRSVHLYPLYGRAGSVTFGGSHYSESFATLTDALALAQAFPPLPRLKVKDSCTSFPTEAWWDAQPDAATPEKEGKVQAVAPFFLEADFVCTPQHGHTPTVEITWCALIAGHILEISVVLAPHTVCRWSFNGVDQRNAYKRITSTDIKFPAGWAAWDGDSLPVLHHQDGGDDTERMEMIRWGRGSDDSGHKFTYYSGCSDADLAHHLQRVIELTAPTPQA